MLKAVLFDYGMVLTEGQDMAVHAEMLRLAGLPFEEFERYYWADRHGYDLGLTTGLEYWRNIVSAARLDLSAAAVAELSRLDGRMWSTANPVMVDWQKALKAQGITTAVLSNMGDEIHRSVAAAHPWLANFDLLVWSYQLRIAKPDPAFYRYALDKLQLRPEEALFLDDRQENIDAAQALGIHAFLFTNAPALGEALRADEFTSNIPLPLSQFSGKI
jgi:putative hydrolase of the HAD superfamily